MALEERLAAVEQELADIRRLSLREAVKDLREAMTVTSYAQVRRERSHQDLAGWNETHSRAITEIRDIQLRTDERIEKLVTAIGQLTVRIGVPPQPPL
jgi:hypothetical protein